MLTAIHKNFCWEVGKTISCEDVSTYLVTKSKAKHETLTATSSEYRKKSGISIIANFLPVIN